VQLQPTALPLAVLSVTEPWYQQDYRPWTISLSCVRPPPRHPQVKSTDPARGYINSRCWVSQRSENAGFRSICCHRWRWSQIGSGWSELQLLEQVFCKKN